jgi:hypothetical protein
MTVYENLPQRDRRAAEKLAKTLLRNTRVGPKSEFSGTCAMLLWLGPTTQSKEV